MDLDLPPDPGERLAQRIARIILLLDIYIGLAWMVESPHRTKIVPSFHPARDVLNFLPEDPQRAWGLALFVLAFGAATLIVYHREQAARYAFAALSGYWCFWMLADLYAAFNPDASLTAPATAAIVVVGHIRQALTTHRLTRRQ